MIGHLGLQVVIIGLMVFWAVYVLLFEVGLA